MAARAGFKFAVLAVLLLQAHSQMVAAQVISSDDGVVARCPASDLKTPAEIRSGIDKSVDHAIAYPSMFAYGTEAIGRVSLPQLLIASGRTNDLNLLWNNRNIQNSADLNAAFHFALTTKDASLMRAVASSNVRRTKTQAPFLAPTSELPALAVLYAKLFERSPDLSAEYRRLAERASTEARQVGPAPPGMQQERPEDRRRLAAAWMLLHLERIRTQLLELGDAPAGSGTFLDRAAALVSPDCQPRLSGLIEALRSGEPACSGREGGGRLLRSDHPYVCSLVEIMGDRR